MTDSHYRWVGSGNDDRVVTRSTISFSAHPTKVLWRRLLGYGPPIPAEEAGVRLPDDT
jgi:hypothetical protein